MNITNRILALLLAGVLLVGNLPLGGMAKEQKSAENTSQGENKPTPASSASEDGTNIKTQKTVAADPDALYAAAYEATMKAQSTGIQADVDAARVAVEALRGTGAEFGIGTFSELLDKVQQTINQESANKVNSAILGLPEKVTARDKKAIVDARKAYDGLRSDAKPLVCELETLKDREKSLADLLYANAFHAIQKARETGAQADVNAARTAIAVLKETDAEYAMGEFSQQVDQVQQAIYQTEAKSVVDAIDALPAVTLDARKSIEAARKAYDALSPEVKTCVTNLSALTAKEAELADLIYAAAFNAVQKAQTTGTQADVDAARAAIEALRGTAGEFAIGGFSQMVDQVQQGIYQAAAQDVIKAIDALPAVTLDARKTIEAARKAYDALSPEVQSCVTNVATLNSKESELADLLYATAFNAVQKAQTGRTQADVDAARAAIEALRGTAGEFAIGEFSKQVDLVQEPLDQAAAEAAGSAIDAIPADTSDASFNKLLADANKKYNALTAGQKARLSAERVEKLNRANNSKSLGEVLTGSKAYQNTKNINKYNVVFSQESELIQARKDLFTGKQKFGQNCSETQLKTVDAELNRIDESLTALSHAAAVIWRIDNLPEKLTAGDTDTMLEIEHARTARRVLTWHTARLVGSSRLQKLERLLGSYEHYEVIPVKEQTEAPDLIFQATGPEQDVVGLRINFVKAEKDKDYIVSSGKDEDGNVVTQITLKDSYLQTLPRNWTVELAVEYKGGMAMAYYRNRGVFEREY